MEISKELLEKAIIGEVVTNYFTQTKPQILKASVYAENKQGSVIAFDGNFCWQIVYSIKENGTFELCEHLSGILTMNSKEEKE